MTRTIGIDNGHYLTTNGKRTPIFTDETKSALTGKNFMHEWEYNRATAVYLDIELKRCGFKTVQVATDNFDTAISTRASRAVQANVDVLISIHANALNGIWGSHGGTEQLACGVESVRIAKLIQEEMVKELKLRDRGIKDGCWLGLVKNAGKIPVVLVETAFMDNLSEAKLLLDEGFRKRSAIAIAKGVCRAYGVKYIPENQSTHDIHIVQQGDTLWQIAQKYNGISVDDILRLNPEIKNNIISVGQKIKLKEQVINKIIDTPKPQPTPTQPVSTNKVIGIAEILASALNVRADANLNARIIRTVSRGSKLNVFESRNGMYRVGQGEWISANTQFVTFKEIYDTVEILASALNVRSLPSFTSKIVKTVSRGQKFNILEEKNGLYRIGQNEWVSASTQFVKRI